MNKSRLDQALVQRSLSATRSQAGSYIKLGYVKVNGKVIVKPGFLISEQSKIKLTIKEQYVSRAALKMASVASMLKLDFKDKVVLDVGSSTGGFTDYALRHGAQKVIAVDVGSNQMHPALRINPKVELHERTDIRDFVKEQSSYIEIVVIDVSFISLREVLPYVAKLAGKNAQFVAMCKPQFEVGSNDVHPSTGSGFRAAALNKGVVKNEAMRRKILNNFEEWAKAQFKIIGKADSRVAGSKGNLERFYLLKLLALHQPNLGKAKL